VFTINKGTPLGTVTKSFGFIPEDKCSPSLLWEPRTPRWMSWWWWWWWWCHDSALSFSKKQFLAKHTKPVLQNSNLFSIINCALRRKGRGEDLWTYQRSFRVRYMNQNSLQKEYQRQFNKQLESWHHHVQCEILGFCSGVNEIFTLLECYAAEICS